MQLGFVIDHDSCIGCHACTVACKAENDVPVGGFRTSVKYVEEGIFPDIKRHFLVQRCNQCTDAPCVEICPVKALEKRPDGIVDVDRDACIGCRACMQACPYDALYLNDDLGAVEKCHFCAHRVEKGLAPACVNVCPVEAIIPGDFHDPNSRVTQITREQETLVRRPEQKTGPNVRYIGAAPAALQPGEAERPPLYVFSDRPPHKPESWPASLDTTPDTRVVLDAGHRVEWQWPVSLYLLTKGLAAGAAILSPFASAFGLTGFWHDYVPEIIALVFLIITCGLLIEDLAKPTKFYRMLTRPNWSSWLVKGGVILTAFGVVEAGLIGARLTGMTDLIPTGRWIGAALGLAVAGYTAFLFAQCKGRDLWESKFLLPHLLVQAGLCGGVLFLLGASAAGITTVAWITAACAAAHIGFAMIERFGHHETANAKQGAAFLGTLTLGGLPLLTTSTVLIALTIPLAFLLPVVAIVPALVGLYLYEHAFIRAGQLPPLS